MIALLDGFDTQIIAFVAPAVAGEWSLPPARIGVLFAAGLAGLAVGAALVGSLADRIGRKKALIASLAWIGVFSLLSALSDGIGMLTLWRFLTGVGLGGAIPNIVAIATEFSPEGKRGRVVTLMFCGFPAGAILGGLLSVLLVPMFGWRIMFGIGGLLPCLLLPFLPFFLEEPRAAAMPGTGRGGFTALFSNARWRRTLALWSTFFANMMSLYLLINWLPLILNESNIGITTAILGTVLLNLGGIIGGLALSRHVDGHSIRFILAAVLVASAGAITMIGVEGLAVQLVLLLSLAAGFGTGGAQLAISALAAGAYPAEIRGTGVGWSYAVGRLGAITGPLVGGAVMAAEVGRPVLFVVAGAPLLLAATAILFLTQRQADR